ncbi:3-keto-5-aminohexanoate cleavage protein [Pseudoalteromonas fuliginea]|uniref:3-keto-5-aminohexanoate cleavage protein n=1 Tax=Pseudoalteromonas fuliginea TaxID=1872678 RepID=A0AB73BM07_9GAMM|nr:3-keto-5-aminohexanoate cleavage protein [Pseudoalteromonas fuliginea]KAA1166156.1 3-keto-5-aminohexanoate cleavage protein [Pseudoalteromonas fuliginea]
MINTPYIINLAPTGIVPKKDNTPLVPLSHNEIVDNILQCAEYGVQMFHIHARDANQQHSNDPEQYGRIIESIRKTTIGKQLVLCVTASGREDSSFESRSKVLELDGEMKPDMASLTLSSLNFINAASVNQPTVIRQLAEKMKQNGIKPEIEVFDLGMLNFLKVLIKEGLVEQTPYVNLLFGNISSAQSTPLEMALLLNELPSSCIKSIAGVGASQLKANSFGLLFADGVRVGLEDNIWFDENRTTLATNLVLVKRIIDLGDIMQRPLLPVNSLRNKLFG